MAQLEHIEAIEKRLWSAADTLRANSNYAGNEYFLPVMGLVFLRHAYSRYLAVKDAIEAGLPTRGGRPRPLTKEDFSQKSAIFLQPRAQFDTLVALPDSADRANAIIDAMEFIEADYENLRGVLPKSEYQELDNAVLGQLLRTLNPEELKRVSGDVFGRIYEYFLTQFADQKAHDGGEFFTPVSLVSLIANVIEPAGGTVLDPACGSGGMFVQSARVVERRHENPTEKLTFYGLEKNATTIRLAKMNLAVHGLEGNIQKAITYYEDPHASAHHPSTLGRGSVGEGDKSKRPGFDFVMANPPFNVDEIDADKVKSDPRLLFGLPGVNKKGKVSNGNYVWISYFYSYLNEQGRAGFVMSSQASSAGRDEAKVRQKLVETGDVDVMVAIRSNFFYTRTVPCELWFIDRGKPDQPSSPALLPRGEGSHYRGGYDFSGLAERAQKLRKKQTPAEQVFWHTQGSGKSYSMVLFTRKVHRKLGGNFTFLILTDRDDLDTQIYKTFAGCGVVDNDRDPCRAASGEHLAQLLAQHKSHVFSLIQKFNQTVVEGEAYTQRDDLIVITDEAHRTQYGTLALNMRNALPNAGYIGFTGTPLFNDDEITRRVFGDYVSTYDFQRAVEDRTTVPLYYDARGDKLGVAVGDLNERIAEKLEELENSPLPLGEGPGVRGRQLDVEQHLEQELKRDYHIITAGKRLDQVARDLVQHYSLGWETGKAMLVCIDKITCVRMHELIRFYWNERIGELVRATRRSPVRDDQEEQYRRRQIEWMRQTQMAVVVSEEQGEVEKFRKWELDITPHRRLIKEGIDLPEAMRKQPQFQNMQRLPLDDAFKAEEHPFRVAIVCAMWLTGFDVPSLFTLYLDKPLKAHTLMQAIARANRVNEGKNNGMIVDYCGILKNLRKALATFAGTGDDGRGGAGGETEPARPNEELLADLREAIALVRAFLEEQSASLDGIIGQTGFTRNAAILAAKEAANENDETRKRFEVMCRAVFSKFKACITIEGVNDCRGDFGAITIVYKSLQQDREQAEITDIIRQLHQVVDEAIETQTGLAVAEESPPYDISKIDFDRLRREFERSPAKRTTVQNLKTAIEQRLQRLLQQNPLRTDFQRHYEEVVAEYNREKDRVTIEKTFDALLQIMDEMDDEENRAVREGLDEESLAVFDLLRKPNLTSSDIKRIKTVAVDLLETLKAEKLRINHWRDKESTRDAVRLTIQDYLWSEQTGLPEAYSEEDVRDKTEAVFVHVFRAYPTVPSPYYAGMAS